MTIRFTTDEVHKQNILEKLKANNGYCPCALVKTEDTKCMCAEFRSQTVPGTCHCGLYIKEDSK